ncbi:Ig-like domain-containing protein [Jiangella alba]|uniref:Ig-like domain-containing protein n=1 Tax=Jiangella alba TaxID=561176 RepID=A0A1H5IK51_9ACTN|nr:Ig-like domain-containing protein [Jiangella alba]SEE40547.1 Ig-like domain-containing protein [Jiangella alba]
MSSPRLRASRRAVIPMIIGLLAALLPGAGLSVPAHAEEETVLSDGFEAGNDWTLYTNGTDGTFGLTADPVHSGSAALTMGAGANPTQSEVGVAAIRSGLSVAEDSSVLSFWYYAGGDATYRGLSVELHTSAKVHSTLLPDVVQLGAWRQVSVRFTDVAPELAGATATTVVIKAITDPAAGRSSFTLDDVEVRNGVPVVVPAPELLAASPAPGATEVGRDRVVTVYFDQPLDPATVAEENVTVVRGRSAQPVAGAVRHLTGARAVAFVPDRPLLPGTTYTVRVDGVRSLGGPALAAPVTTTFTTGARMTSAEQSFADDFTEIGDWRLYSNAAGPATQTLTADPALAPGQALTASASDPAQAFVLSHLHPLPVVDENSVLSFSYFVTGTAGAAELQVMLTSADGRSKQVSLDAGEVRTGEWATASVAVPEVSRSLTGFPLTSMEIKLATATGGDARFSIDRVRVGSDPAAFELLPPAESGEGRPRLSDVPAADRQRIRDLADHILTTQNPDGTIPVGPEGLNSTRYVGYFSTFAALGLVRAYELTRDQRYLDGALLYAGWYRDHLNPDGSMNDFAGTWPDLTDTLTADSVDSYASTYLLLLEHLVQVQGSRAAQDATLDEWFPIAQRVFGALNGTYVANGQTEVRPGYPVQFIQDNSETWFGLQAMAWLAGAAGDAPTARVATALAGRTQYGIRQAYLRDATNDYGVAVTRPSWEVQPTGPLDTWYPDALSNVLPLGVIGGGPGQPDGGDAALLRRLVQQFDVERDDTRPTHINDTQMYLWWAMAGLTTGQPELARHFAGRYDDAEGVGNPAALGFAAAHLIRVLSFPYDDTLWF